MKDVEIPWWVNAIYKVGVPTAIACYLVWVLVNKVQAQQESFQMQINNLQTLVSTHVATSDEDLKVNLQMLDAIRRICINTSESKVERDECVK